MIIFGYDNFIMILINVYEVDSPGVKTHYCSLKSLMRNHLRKLGEDICVPSGFAN